MAQQQAYLAHDVIPVVLAALVEDVVDTLVEERRRHVVDRFDLRHLVGRVGRHLRSAPTDLSVEWRR